MSLDAITLLNWFTLVVATIGLLGQVIVYFDDSEEHKASRIALIFTVAVFITTADHLGMHW